MDDEEFDLDPAFFSQEANNSVEQCITNVGVTVSVRDFPWTPTDASFAADMVSFKDSIHSTIWLPDVCSRVVHTPQFKRLGGLCQLGKAHCVFPAAQHKRLEHSLGVAHLTRLQLEALFRNQPELRDEVEPREARNVVVAGLCHDLGHGPLSHVFEKEFLRLHGVVNWEHEDMSVRILRHLVEQNGIEDVDDSDLEFVGNVIRGRCPDATCPSRRFLFDIVSNDRNGVDTDRMDYLLRDAVHCGVSDLGASPHRLLEGAKVLDGQICYPLSEASNVWAVYSDRWRMFRDVYTCRRVKAAEFMAAEALKEAEPVLGLLDLVWEPKTFCALDDSILQAIQHYHVRHPRDYAGLGEEARAALGRAQALLTALDCGRTYPCCGELRLPDTLLMSGRWEAELRPQFTLEGVVEHAAGGEAERRALAGQLIVSENRIDAGKGGGDPMEKVGFYDDCDASGGTQRRLLSQAELEGLGRPACLQERTLRVYVRKCGDAALQAAATRAFAAWCNSRPGLGLSLGPVTEADVLPPGEEGAAAGAPLAPPRQVAMRGADARAATLTGPQLPPTPAVARAGCGGPAGGRTKRRRPSDTEERAE